MLYDDINVSCVNLQEEVSQYCSLVGFTSFPRSAVTEKGTSVVSAL